MLEGADPDGLSQTITLCESMKIIPRRTVCAQACLCYARTRCSIVSALGIPMHPRGLTCFGSPAPNSSTAVSRRRVQLLYIV